jgi:hypothetical protein
MLNQYDVSNTDGEIYGNDNATIYKSADGANILRGAGHFDCTYKNIVMGCITIACALLGSHK